MDSLTFKFEYPLSWYVNIWYDLILWNVLSGFLANIDNDVTTWIPPPTTHLVDLNVVALSFPPDGNRRGFIINAKYLRAAHKYTSSYPGNRTVALPEWDVSTARIS